MSSTATLKNSSSQIAGRLYEVIKEKAKQYPYLTKSLILHFSIVLLVSGMLPTCSKKIETPKTIAVSIMPLGEAEKTVPQTKQQEVKKEEAKQDEPKPLPPKEVKKSEDATKMEKADKPEPIAKPEEKKPTPKKIEKKPEPKKEVKKQDKQKKDDKDQEGKKKLLKDLEKKDQAALENIFDAAAQDNPTPAIQPAQASGKSEAVDASLINDIIGAVQSKVEQNWNIPIGVKDVQNIKVPLYIRLDRNANVIEVKIIDQIRYSTDNSYRVLADSAVWAVKEASPFTGLPSDKFNSWSELVLSFDPSNAL